MMRNPEYNWEEMAESTRELAAGVQQVGSRLGWQAKQLKGVGSQYSDYHHVHLDETLAGVAKTLTYLTERVEQLRRYTQYPGHDIQDRMNERKEAQND